MHKNSSVKECYLIDLPKFKDHTGSLGFIEGSNHIPFDIARIYYIYNVAQGRTRGSHAHKELKQLIFAISGSFDIILNDGFLSKKYTLSRPNQGLYVCPMIWRDLEVFSEGAICMVLASHVYEPTDYIHDYKDFCMKKI